MGVIMAEVSTAALLAAETAVENLAALTVAAQEMVRLVGLMVAETVVDSLAALMVAEK